MKLKLLTEDYKTNIDLINALIRREYESYHFQYLIQKYERGLELTKEELKHIDIVLYRRYMYNDYNDYLKREYTKDNTYTIRLKPANRNEYKGYYTGLMPVWGNLTFPNVIKRIDRDILSGNNKNFELLPAVDNFNDYKKKVVKPRINKAWSSVDI